MAEQRSFLEGVRPSFAPPRLSGPGRPIAVIDVGSNSVRLVVFESAERAPAYYFNEKVACGLGAEISRTGRLDPRGRQRAIATLTRFAALADRMRVGGLDAVATAAVREAEDGADFCKAVHRATGLRLRVISGEEEARLSALGVLLAEPDAEGLVVDMGGASMEIATVAAGAVGERLTLALGPQRLSGLDGAKLLARIDSELARALAALGKGRRPIHLVGGAWRTFAKLQMARVDHPLRVLHGYSLEMDAAAEAAAWVAVQTPETLRAVPGVSAQRAATAPLAALVLSRLIVAFCPPTVLVSAFGLREGLYYEQLPPVVRARDPLIDGAKRLELQQARFPGFGRELAGFVAPIIKPWTADERRLALAACLLNDVNWRAHPDYRPLSCFETVTRANLTGLDHAARVFIGFALLNRYGGGRYSADVAEALKLLDSTARDRAKTLGRALRLGAMLSASTSGALAHAKLALTGETLSLHLGRRLRLLNGEAVSRRLTGLADTMGVAGQLTSSD